MESCAPRATLECRIVKLVGRGVAQGMTISLRASFSKLRKTSPVTYGDKPFGPLYARDSVLAAVHTDTSTEGCSSAKLSDAREIERPVRMQIDTSLVLDHRR